MPTVKRSSEEMDVDEVKFAGVSKWLKIDENLKAKAAGAGKEETEDGWTVIKSHKKAPATAPRLGVSKEVSRGGSKGGRDHGRDAGYASGRGHGDYPKVQ